MCQRTRLTCAAPATVSERVAFHIVKAPRVQSIATGTLCWEGIERCFRQPGYRPTRRLDCGQVTFAHAVGEDSTGR